VQIVDCRNGSSAAAAPPLTLVNAAAHGSPDVMQCANFLHQDIDLEQFMAT